jgi:Kef-type K+ transport system membrane component KefB
MFEGALPYVEPGVVTILILSSFMLVLNLIGYALDRIIYCGLVGQILVGIAWGLPGAHWLSTATQQVFVQLGYLGLILLVFEGGLSTDFQALKSNFVLSVCVALTGIVAPIGMSFVLMSIADATPLQAFAAGAALCSTSLGTTFSVLKTSQLTQSRLGVVLTSAAMLDDVVGLVMVQIISNLGAADSSSLVVTVVRPVAVSLAFAFLVPLACWLSQKLWRGKFSSFVKRRSLSASGESQVAFLVHTAVLLGFVAASSYAGTSDLFAAYLAGSSISWYDSDATNILQKASTPPSTGNDSRISKEEPIQDALGHIFRSSPAPVMVVSDREKIGPVEGGEAKLLSSPAVLDNGDGQPCVLRLGTETKTLVTPDEKVEGMPSVITAHEKANDIESPRAGTSTWEIYYETPVSTILRPLFFASIGFSIPIGQMFAGAIIWRGFVYAALMALGKLLCGLWLVRLSANTSTNATKTRLRKERNLPRPTSLYPALIVGCAMVARGEIGFLISAVAESRGTFSPTHRDRSSDLFLIATWAIMLCTITGPIAVGLLTKRVRRLQSGRSEGGEDPLGIWRVL